ncbi:MAG TPA: DNA gyrase C-terminal beta-propeller domain-containing protein, partial [Acidiferrobacteraceae bacterium]|nr:DNA gyrase C-terminal beta-propeller domain-containing protein [Acidiferrobacteraceae bacterium]
AQRRGGKGRAATRVKEEDFVERLVIANTHDTILCFSSQGKVYWLKVYELPQAGRTAQGRPLVNLLPLVEGEHIQAILSIRSFDDGKHVFMATSDGTVKKTALSEFSRPRPSGIIAVDLAPGNCLVGVALTSGNDDVLLFSDGGKVVRFAETDVRAVGRSARGVRGLLLKDDQRLISMIVAATSDADAEVLTATENGYGKRTPLADYPRHNRGGQGVISIQVGERNGNVVCAELVRASAEVMLITNAGTLIRTYVREISVTGRNTQGVRLIGLDGSEKLVGLEPVDDDAGAAMGDATPPAPVLDS